MTDHLPNNLVAAEQPGGEIHIVDGLFIKQIILKTAGLYVPQHAHRYDHVSVLANGSVRVWRDGGLIGDRVAPCGIVIPAGAKHTFLSLEDQTVLLCVHRIDRTGEVEIAAEHQIVG